MIAQNMIVSIMSREDNIVPGLCFSFRVFYISLHMCSNRGPSHQSAVFSYACDYYLFSSGVCRVRVCSFCSKVRGGAKGYKQQASLAWAERCKLCVFSPNNIGVLTMECRNSR